METQTLLSNLSAFGNDVSSAIYELDNRSSMLEETIHFDYTRNETIISWTDHRSGEAREMSLNKLHDAIEVLDNLDNKLSNIEERMDAIEYYSEEIPVGK